MSTSYNPQSHFFVDDNALEDAVSGNLAADGFGPVSGSPTTQYRTTSFVRASGLLTKVFAICDGRVLIQPMDGDNTKVNLILKPESSYSPLKIKYFIYRGVNKSDLLLSDTLLKPTNETDPLQPPFIRRLWQHYIRFNMTIPDMTPPTEFKASLIGYDINQPGNTLIESCFFNSDNNGSQIPMLKKGEYLGNFTGKIGLDIVLDYGDYILTNQEELFRLDLAYARKAEHIFDTTTITGSVKVKRLKEHIHQFIDAAAFWGSHIECGRVKLVDDSGGIFDNENIYNKILKKYQTKNKIYVYIQAEHLRSYNYFKPNRKVHGFNLAGELNETNGWPILIREKESTGNTFSIDFALEADIDTKIVIQERNVSTVIIAPNNNTTLDPKVYVPEVKVDIDALEIGALGGVDRYFDYQLPKKIIGIDINSYKVRDDSGSLPPGLGLNQTTGQITGTPNQSGVFKFVIEYTYDTVKKVTQGVTFEINPQVKLGKIKFQANLAKSCASFIIIHCNLIQDFPYVNYYDGLWPVNVNSIYSTSSGDNGMHWATYDRNTTLNMNPILDMAACIQNKVVYDVGTKNGESPSTINRRLYLAVLKENTNTGTWQSAVFNNLNIHSIKSGKTKAPMNAIQYAKNVYDDDGFFVYRGQAKEASANFDTLSLIHETDFDKKNSHFHLGIIEEEYNLLVYNSTTIPGSEDPPHIPPGSVNVYFHIQEINTPSMFLNKYRKFKLGLRYEDENGIISEPLFPSSSGNDVYVYTLDGYYFFSKKYSEHQKFYKEFAPAQVEFGTMTVIPKYAGEFGFDWLRTVGNGEVSYDSAIENGYHRPSTDNINNVFRSPEEAYKFLIREYPVVPTKKQDFESYYIPYLNLFSKEDSDKMSVSVDMPKPPFEATLRVLSKIDEDFGKLEFDYDTTIFSVVGDALPNTAGANTDTSIKITCKKSFDTRKQIKVLAYPVGVTDKKQASLAGIILLNANGASYRKELKVALVKVNTKTDNFGPVQAGSYFNEEKINLYKTSYQMFIQPIVVEKLKIGNTEEEIILNLTNDNKFKKGSNATGGYVNDAEEVVNSRNEIHKYLREKLYTQQSGYAQFKKYFVLFAFGLQGRGSEGKLISGQAEGVGIRCANLFVRDSTTMSHEYFHGLGLHHTHFNNTISEISSPEQKFIFPNGNGKDDPIATYNLMSYCAIKIYLWNWQLNVVNKKMLK